MIESVRETGGRIERETRFLHYAGGVVDGRARAARPRSLGGSERFALGDGYGFPRRRLPRPQDRAPADFTPIKQRASKPMRNAAAAKGSMCLKRKAAAWDDDFRASLVAE